MDLLEKLKESQKKIKKDIKNRLNPNSSFGTLTDDEIALVLAVRAKQTRLCQNKKQSDVSKEANLSSQTTYSNFEQTGAISMVNFIKVMRVLGKLNELENLLQTTPKDAIKKIKERVR